jgi:multiple sugar transport system substrate-binding protein
MSSYFLWEYLWSNGATVLGRKNDKLDIVLDEGENLERAIETVNYLKELYKYSPVSSNWNWAEQIEAYWTGGVAEAKYWGARPKLQAIDKNAEIAPYTKPVPPPYKRKSTAMSLWEGFCLFKGAANPEGAIEFAKFLFQKEPYLEVMLMTAPIHNLPAITPVLKSREYMEAEFIAKNFTKEDLATCMHILEISKPMIGETEPFNSYAPIIFSSYKLGDILFKTLVERENVEKVIKENALEMRKVLRQAQGA